MQNAPVLKASGLAPVEDEPVHVFGSNLEQRVVESKGDELKSKEQDELDQESIKDDDVETIKKRKFDAITGEEEEETVFQGDFKLFSWCLDTSNWIEKGRGQLKLNDSVRTNENRSRVIMRTGGTYRIVLNVAIKHSFFKVISNNKTNIRFTDSLTVWAASGSNAGQLAELIKERLEEDAKSAPIDSTKTTDNTKSEACKTESPVDETKITPKGPEPAPQEATKGPADESKTPTDQTDGPAEDDSPTSSDEAQSTDDKKDTTPAVQASEDTTDNNPSSTEIKTDANHPSAECTKSSVNAFNSASRRHSGTSEELDDSELGVKKLKHSSD